MAGLLCALFLALSLAACGDTAGGGSTPTGTGTSTGTGTGTSAGTGTGTGGSIDLSAVGVDTKTISHADFTAGATHSAKLCTECHAVTREKVCAQAGCHPFSKYAAVMTNWDHIGSKTGEQCGRCHYSAEKNIASENPKVAGFRQTLRIGGAKWHGVLKGVCLDCHLISGVANFPASHSSDPARQASCQTCHFYSINAGGVGVWGRAPHPVVTTGCAGATCHTHTIITAETHYQGGTAPSGQHYNANTGGPYSCEWCHAETIAGGYASWSVAFSKTGHQGWNGGACKACHPNGIAHPAVTTGCAGATCHTHTITTAETHYQGGTAPSGQHYNANTGGPYSCEWCHAGAIASGYASWSVAFDKTTHQSWNGGSCKACHPNGGAHPAVTTGCRAATCHTHAKPATELHQDNTNYSGQHYDANTGGPFECEWCHTGVAAAGYTSWSLPFSKRTHQNWNNSSCKACHPNQIPD